MSRLGREEDIPNHVGEVAKDGKVVPLKDITGNPSDGCKSGSVSGGRF